MDVKRYYIKIFLFIILLITGICLQTKAGENTADFKLLFVQSTDGYDCEMDIENTGTLAADKEFKLFFKPISTVYLYLLLRDPADEFVMIFPGSFKVFSTKDYCETEYFIPEDGNWIQFKKQPGKHTLYFLVSEKRLKELENLIKKYQDSSITEDQDGADSNKKLLIAHLHQIQRNSIFNNNKRVQEGVMGSGRDDDVQAVDESEMAYFKYLEVLEDYIDAAIEINVDDIYVNVYTLLYE